VLDKCIGRTARTGFEEFPDYVTQSRTTADLPTHWKDLWQDLTSGAI